MKLLSVNDRVDNGVRFLDVHGPDGWRGQIDVSNLDIESGATCVVGQLFSDWELGHAELELRECSDDAVFLGFLPAKEDDGEALTASWRSVLLGTRPLGTPPRVRSESDVLPWQCGWQSAYGMPWDEYCSAPRGEGDEYCPEHERNFAESYPHLARA
ncbi:hypothetical protein [Streptomyces yaizuensis]|uniref:Uncharacterized protein n=1 Tax=Streptomyces yaizuensis TaxID=2989713 RepID=A0ABQ5PBZ1_9ACTN|nr:hypothetical protein [Streptomyces sp. YSPA8]GLF99921.1 hypothetical protein SYYSPA8_36510 [Streptomyces sp. YSPA8]